MSSVVGLFCKAKWGFCEAPNEVGLWFFRCVKRGRVNVRCQVRLGFCEMPIKIGLFVMSQVRLGFWTFQAFCNENMWDE